MRPHYHARKHTGRVVTVRDGRGYVVVQNESRQQSKHGTTAQEHTEREKPSGKMTPLHALSSLTPLTSRPHSCCSALHQPSRLTAPSIERKGRGEAPVVGRIRVEG
jgi:hypothetical protein